jgi:hypothetical protein
MIIFFLLWVQYPTVPAITPFCHHPILDNEANSDTIQKKPFLRLSEKYAWVAELVDARDLKSLGRKAVRVRFSSQALQ